MNAKLKEFRVTQIIVASLLNKQPTSKLITTTRQSIDQMTQDLTTLMVSYTKIKKEIWNTVKPSKDDEGGSGMSHK